jgi:hypothetical protein
MQFNIGDKVQWASQAQGTMLTKMGTIIVIVNRHKRPPLGKYAKTHIWRYGGGSSRPEVSYLVEVKRFHKKTGKEIKPLLYWPKVKDLRLVD